MCHLSHTYDSLLPLELYQEKLWLLDMDRDTVFYHLRCWNKKRKACLIITIYFINALTIHSVPMVSWKKILILVFILMKERLFNTMKIFYSKVLENHRKDDQSWFKSLDCSVLSVYDSLTTEVLAQHWTLRSSGLSCIHLVIVSSILSADLCVILTFSVLCVEIHFRPKELSSQKLVKANGSGFNELVCLAQKFCQKYSQELVAISFMIQLASCCNNSLCPFSLAVRLEYLPLSCLCTFLACEEQRDLHLFLSCTEFS